MDIIRSSSIAGQGTGGPPDAEILLGNWYAELRRVAGRELARGGSDPSLGVATLLHDAYVDVSARHGGVFPDEAHFMGYAATSRSRRIRASSLPSVRRSTIWPRSTAC